MFYENVKRLCYQHGISLRKMAEEIGINTGTITAWKNGRMPRGETVKKVADYFGVTTDYLLTGNEAKAVATYDPDTELFVCMDMLKDAAVRKILLRLKGASPGELKKVTDMLDVLLGGEVTVG